MTTIVARIKELHSPKGTGENQGEKRSVRRLIAGFFLVLISALLTVASASAAHADLNNNAPNITVAGYGVAANTTVVCDPATHSMSVTGSTSVMQQPGYAGGYTNGPFDNGQYVRYSLWSRDVNGGALGFPTLKLTGKAGHSYQALVQIDYWPERATSPTSLRR